MSICVIVVPKTKEVEATFLILILRRLIMLLSTYIIAVIVQRFKSPLAYRRGIPIMRKQRSKFFR